MEQNINLLNNSVVLASLIAAGVSFISLLFNIIIIYFKPEFERKSKNKDRYSEKQYFAYENMFNSITVFVDKITNIFRRIPDKEGSILNEGYFIANIFQEEMDIVFNTINVNSLYIEKKHEDEIFKYLKRFMSSYSTYWGKITAKLLNDEKNEREKINNIITDLAKEVDDDFNDIVIGEVLHKYFDIFNMLKFSEINNEVIYEKNMVQEDKYNMMVRIIIQYRFRKELEKMIKQDIENIMICLTKIKDEFREKIGIPEKCKKLFDSVNE